MSFLFVFRDPFYQDQDFSDIEDPVDDSDEDEDFRPSGINSKRKQVDDGEDYEEEERGKKTSRGKGRGRGRGRGGGRGRPKKVQTCFTEQHQ